MAFIIKNQQLISAAEEYAKACSNYETAMAKLKTIMQEVTEQWKDEAAEKWQGLVPQTIADLEKIKSNLAYNSSLLKEVAAKASESQSEIRAQINNLYLS